MAGVLELSDGTTTVDLLSENDHYLKRKGYGQRVAPLDPETGEPLPVEDTLRVTWRQSDDDDRADVLQDLLFLGRKAQRQQAGQLTYDYVWLKVQTHTEANARWYIVHEVNTPELDHRHWHAGAVTLAIAVVRDGASWELQPGTYPSSADAGATTIENNINGADANYDTVADTALTGDTSALSLVQLASFTSTPDTVLVAMRSAATTAELNDFVPIINADNHDFTATGVTKAPDANAPDGQRLLHMALNTIAYDFMCGAPLQGDLSNHYGTFAVYLVAKASADDIYTVRVGHSTTGADGTTGSDSLKNPGGPGVVLPATTTHVPHYVGQVTLPAGRRIDDLTDPANYYINYNITIPAANGGSNIEIWALWIVPTEKLARLHPEATSLRIDGRHGHAYHYGASDVYVDAAPALRGAIPTMPVNEHCRWYLFWWRPDTASNGYVPGDTCSMTIYAINRWRGLRGAT